MYSVIPLISACFNLSSTELFRQLSSLSWTLPLAFTFSDSFWYNAVEAEVYAMAMLFISLLFWLGLRWEQEMNTPRGNRWLLLISLIIGLTGIFKKRLIELLGGSQVDQDELLLDY